MTVVRKFRALFVALLILSLALPVAAQDDMTADIQVSDQEVLDGVVVVDTVMSPAAGWVVVHGDEEGVPGPILGYMAVGEGETTNVEVDVDPNRVTGTLYVLLYEDLGTADSFDVPGADVPMEAEGTALIRSFTVTDFEEEMEEEMEEMTPSVAVSDQDVMNGVVQVDRVVSDGPGWIVIHADENGSPGPVIGQASVSDGENTNVRVTIDTDMVTERLYAMLHTDAGTEGTYEFPGDDVPVQVNGQVVVTAFVATDVGVVEAEMEAEAEEEEPETLPAAGANTLPWLGVALFGAGLLALTGGLVLKRLRA
ncbi:MAG: hypothetical protein ACLFU8_03245 [Anaerolineales bacterium]